MRRSDFQKSLWVANAASCFFLKIELLLLTLEILTVFYLLCQQVLKNGLHSFVQYFLGMWKSRPAAEALWRKSSWSFEYLRDGLGAGKVWKIPAWVPFILFSVVLDSVRRKKRKNKNKFQNKTKFFHFEPCKKAMDNR